MSGFGGESPWYCRHCELWIGWKHDRCGEGHTEPVLPLRYDDVKKRADRVTLGDRLRAKVRRLTEVIRR